MPKTPHPPVRRSQTIATVIFDGDDTLWETQTLYDLAKRKFAALMAKEGFPSAESLALFAEVDMANVRKLGFSRRRFPKSMADTYELLAKDAGKKVKPAVRKRAKALGESVFNRTPKLMPGVRRLLQRLTGRVRLVLMTAGDRAIQRRRIQTSGLARYFDFIDIPKIKDAAEFHRLIRLLRVNPDSAWMIGNSMKSDIMPAHKVGLNTVWLAGRGWAYDRSDETGDTVTKVVDLEGVRRVLEANVLGVK